MPLGVLLHNENKLDEMGYIMDRFMKLVPQQPDEAIAVLPNGDVLEFDNIQFSKILLGGDQLTAARARGTQAIRRTESTPANRLQGLIPVIEDWHVRMSLMKVMVVQEAQVSVILIFIICDPFWENLPIRADNFFSVLLIKA